MDWALNVSIANSSRQVPRILRHQILCKLTDQYMEEGSFDFKLSGSQGLDARGSAAPSIQRFYGSMLFVDISGFTALSLRLDVEPLKNHINEYFTKMLEIVEKWGGDVIKFAGDALYIIWRTEMPHVSASNDGSISSSSSDNDTTAAGVLANVQYQANAKVAIEKAVACGLEINANCSNHRVVLTGKATAASRWNMIFSSIPSIIGNNDKKVAPTSTPPKQPEMEAYLNVHSGVGYGLMVGIDVGSLNRWEYFLLGDPISQVATAESRAATGDLVISPRAHHLLHPDASLPSDSSTQISASLLTCGCSRLEEDYCKICNLDALPTKASVMLRRRSKPKLRPDEQPNGAGANESNDKVIEELNDDMDVIFSSLLVDLKTKVLEYVIANKVNVGKLLSLEEDVFIDDISNIPHNAEMFCVDFLTEKIRPSFTSLFLQSMLDDLIRHNHEASRTKSEFYGFNRVGAFWDALSQEIPVSTPDSPSSPPGSTLPPLLRRQSTDSFRSLFRMISKTDVNSRSSSEVKMVRRQSSRNNRMLSSTRTSKASIVVEEAGLSAELRTVTVMFIKIESISSYIQVDETDGANHHTHHSNYSDHFRERFHFLQRTSNEMLKDMELLTKLQDCMKVLNKAFLGHGGQMRQFIIDDKGTVCIGTFGLRGSMASDNAAAAIEVAKEIIINLQGIGLIASVGITCGKTYCGWVGSPSRHEFAVMGPSTNLSARLMSQAPAYCVVCDQDTKVKDRTHEFELIGEIKAKGYPQLVRTYKPVFEDLGNVKGLSDAALAALSPSTIARNRIQGMLRSSLDSFNLSSLLVSAKIGDLTSFKQSMVSTRTTLTPKSHHTEKEKPKARDTLTTIGILVESEFQFFKKQANAQLDTSNHMDDISKRLQSTLYGREEELNKILKFLFLGIVKNVLHRKAPNKDHISGMWRKLNTSLACRMVVVGGKEGIGKSALLNSVARKFFSMQKHDNQCNIAVFKNRPSSSFNVSSSPFYAWKSVLQDLLRYAYTFLQPSKQTSDSVDNEAAAGLKRLVPQMPDDLHPYLPLLGWMGVLPHMADTPETLALHPPQKAAKAVDVIVFLLQSFCSVTGLISLLVFEKLQFFDAWSLSLLHKVWANTSGVVILASISTNVQLLADQHNTHLASSSEDSRDSNGIAVGGEAAPSIDSHVMLRKFDNNERFLPFELPVLKKEAMMKVVKEILSGSKQLISNEVLEKIHEVSGGNAMYAYEIAHSIVHKAAKNKDMSLLSHLEQHLLTNNSGRIEEIICYRFDQLDITAQIVLKHAAVIASNGHSFDIQLLKYVLLEHNSTNLHKHHHHHNDNVLRKSVEMHKSAVNVPESTIISTLQRLLQDEEFLAICPEDDEENSARSSLKEDIHVAVFTSKFSFRAVIEQMTIYNLLILEQKEQIHEKIAFYYHIHQNSAVHESKQQYNQPVTISTPMHKVFIMKDDHAGEDKPKASDKKVNIPDLLEEGYHWQHASIYNDALKTYFLAVQVTKHMQQTTEQEDMYMIQFILTLCHKAYLLMKNDMSIVYSADMSFSVLQALVTSTPLLYSSNSTSSEQINKADTCYHTLTYSKLLELCFDDVEVLYVVVAVLIDIAQYALIYYTNPNMIAVVTTEAMEILHLIIQNNQPVHHTTKALTPTGLRGLSINTNTPVMLNVNKAGVTPRSSRTRSSQNTPKNVASAILTPHISTPLVFNPTSMKYHIYTIYLQAHALSLAKEPVDKLQKAAFLSSFMLEHVHLEQLQYNNMHILQALSNNLLVSLRRHDSEQKIVEQVDNIFSLYSAEAMSPHLVYYYAVDTTLYTLAVALQFCLMKSRLSYVEKYFSRLLQELYNLEHVHSIITSAVPVISLCMGLRRYKEALTLLEYMQGLSLYADTMDAGINRSLSNAGEGRAVQQGNMMIDHIYLSEAYITRLHILLLILNQLFPNLQPDGTTHSTRSIRSNISLKLRTSGTIRSEFLLSHEFYNDLTAQTNPSDPTEDSSLYNMIFQSTHPSSSVVNPVIESYLFFSGLSETTLYALSILIKNYYQYTKKKSSLSGTSTKQSHGGGGGALQPVQEDIFPWKKISLYIEKLCKRSLYYQLGSINVYHILLLIHSVLLQYDLSVAQESSAGLSEYTNLMSMWMQLAEEFMYYHQRYNDKHRYQSNYNVNSPTIGMSMSGKDNKAEPAEVPDALAVSTEVSFDLLVGYTMVYILHQVVLPAIATSEDDMQDESSNSLVNLHQRINYLKEEIEGKYLGSDAVLMMKQHFQNTTSMTGAINVAAAASTPTK